MIISFVCVQCEADFDLEVASLVREPTSVICPNCGIKGNPSIIENAATAMDEAVTQFARLSRKFKVGFAMEPDEISDILDEDFLDQDDDGEGLWSDDPGDEDEDLD